MLIFFDKAPVPHALGAVDDILVRWSTVAGALPNQAASCHDIRAVAPNELP